MPRSHSKQQRPKRFHPGRNEWPSRTRQHATPPGSSRWRDRNARSTPTRSQRPAVESEVQNEREQRRTSQGRPESPTLMRIQESADWASTLDHGLVDEHPYRTVDAGRADSCCSSPPPTSALACCAPKPPTPSRDHVPVPRRCVEALEALESIQTPVNCSNCGATRYANYDIPPAVFRQISAEYATYECLECTARDHWEALARRDETPRYQELDPEEPERRTEEIFRESNHWVLYVACEMYLWADYGRLQPKTKTPPAVRLLSNVPLDALSPCPQTFRAS